MKDLLTIPEFVELSGKKKQGIYEAVKNENSRLFAFVVKQDGKTFIKREALQFYQEASQADSQDSKANSQEEAADSQDHSQESQGESQADSQDSKAQSQGGQADSQADFIAFLKGQIEEKDRLIEELRKTKDREVAELHRLLFNQQELHARDRALLMEYQERDKKEEAPPQEVVEHETIIEEKPQEDQEPKKKSNWFRRWLFGEE